MDIVYINECLEKIDKIYSDILLTSNYCRCGSSISWNRYESGIYSKLLYAKEYEELVSRRQYSFLLKDKSFFQFYYDFVGHEINKAKLCYYPYPIANQEDDIALEEYFCQSGTDILECYYFGLKELRDIGVVSTNNSHFRLDFDSKVDSHCKSHAQYSGINELRIPFNHIVDPLLFFEFIIQSAFEGYMEIQDNIESSSPYKHAMSISKKKVKDISTESGLHLQYKP